MNILVRNQHLPLLIVVVVVLVCVELAVEAHAKAVAQQVARINVLIVVMIVVQNANRIVLLDVMAFVDLDVEIVALENVVRVPHVRIHALETAQGVRAVVRADVQLLALVHVRQVAVQDVQIPARKIADGPIKLKFKRYDR